jgi:hypothetical protein
VFFCGQKPLWIVISDISERLYNTAG